MPTVINISTELLRRRQAAIDAELRAAEPVRMAELDLIRAQLDSTTTTVGRFSAIREVREATEILLWEYPHGLSKNEIATKLLAGGFYNAKQMRPYLIQNSLNYHIKQKRFIERDGIVLLPVKLNP